MPTLPWAMCPCLSHMWGTKICSSMIEKKPGYPLVIEHSEWTVPAIVDFPIKDGKISIAMWFYQREWLWTMGKTWCEVVNFQTSGGPEQGFHQLQKVTLPKHKSGVSVVSTWQAAGIWGSPTAPVHFVGSSASAVAVATASTGRMWTEKQITLCDCFASFESLMC